MEDILHNILRWGWNVKGVEVKLRSQVANALEEVDKFVWYKSLDVNKK